MSSVNPYAPPQAEVALGEEFQEVRLWSVQGRIGRLRFLAYNTAFFFVSTAAFLGLLALAVAMDAFGLLGLGVLLLVALDLAFWVQLAIRRCHDVNLSGWAVLGVLIPGAIFAFPLLPGTRAANRFGAPPPRNTRGIKLLALGVPVMVVVMGMVVAISLPVYLASQSRAAAAAK